MKSKLCSLFMNILTRLLGFEDKYAIVEISNIQLDSEAVRTKTIETRWNECKKYLNIIHFALSLSSERLSQS